MTDHPITPPPELVEEWYDSIHGDSTSWKQELATKAARWGADQELDACCEHINLWFATPKYRVAELRAARRPKPKSLAEEALEVLNEMNAPLGVVTASRCDTIRRALKRLQELEGQGDG